MQKIKKIIEPVFKTNVDEAHFMLPSCKIIGPKFG